MGFRVKGSRLGFRDKFKLKLNGDIMHIVGNRMKKQIDNDMETGFM